MGHEATTAAVSNRPQTRAFLFADLRGYSAYTERHGDQAAERLIARYRSLVREQIAAFSGAEIRTEGDSFYVVFASVSEAVEAAVAIRDSATVVGAGARELIPVGIGIHAGESRDGEHGIVSSAVNVAARVCAVSGAGEVLVTETVRSLVRTAMPIEFHPAGRRRLKGIAEPIALYRVQPPTAAVGARRRPSAGLLIGAAFAVILLAVMSRDSASSGSNASAETDAPAASRPEVSAEPEETHDLSRFNDAGEFPNAAEAELLDHLLTEVADRCQRADPEDVPILQYRPGDDHYGRPVPLSVPAGLSCLVDGTRIHYWQGSGALNNGHATDLFFLLARHLSLQEGDCATESRVYHEWAAGTHSGDILCYASVDGSAVVEWTFVEENIYAVARRRDGGLSALYEWWLDTGRLLR